MASIQPQSGGSGRNRTRGGRSKAVIGDSNAQQPAIRLKIVIRHLPSFLKEAEFREEMKDTINDDTCDYFSWIQGKVSSDHNKTPTPTRCYVRLKAPQQIPALNAALRAHGPFTDKQGNTTTAQLEYAPFQKVSKKTQRNDTRQNTIESDPDFTAFVASLQGDAPPAAEPTADGETPAEPTPLDFNAPAPVPVNDPMSVPMPVVEAYEKPTTTPLIEHIRAQKSQPDKNQKGKAVAAPEVSKGSRRADRRAREKEMKRKGRETPPVEQRVEPMALLKRADTGPGRLQQQRGQVPPSSPRQERERPSEGERKRGVAGAAATVQKVLGIGPRLRGARGGAGRANQGGPVVDTKSAASTPSSSPSTPVEQTTPAPPTQPAQQAVQQAAQQPPSSPKRTRDRPSRRERRAAKLEREDSSAAPSSPGPSSPKQPVAMLKRQGSSNAPAPVQRHPTAPNPVNRGGPSNAAPTVPMLMKREGSSAATAAPAAPAPQRPAQNTAVPPRSPMANNTPTGPRGGFRGPMRGAPPGRGGGRNPFGPQQNQPPGPPTGPAADMPHGPRGGRGRGGGGGGGRGGGPFRGGPAMRGRAPPPSPGAAAPTGN